MLIKIEISKHGQSYWGYIQSQTKSLQKLQSGRRQGQGRMWNIPHCVMGCETPCVLHVNVKYDAGQHGSGRGVRFQQDLCGHWWGWGEQDCHVLNMWSKSWEGLGQWVGSIDVSLWGKE